MPLPRRPDRRARRRADVLGNTTGIVGFFGASSMERLPTEIAMTENMRRFKSIAIGRAIMSGRFITDADIVRDQVDWGVTGWISRPSFTGSTSMCVMDVHLQPGGGHAFHRHPDQEEIIWVREGRIEQWLEDAKQELGPGRGGLHPEGRRPRVVHGRRTRRRSSA